MKKLCLIDGSGFIFRAFHALPPLTTKDGTPVNAVYGFVKSILNLKENTTCDYIAVVFDSKRKTFRNDIYPEYKANRPPPPDELIPQFDLIREAVKALNIASIEKEGFEADDLIATFTEIALKEKLEVQIISSDKDLMQLVDDENNIYMYDTFKKRKVTSVEVQEKFGVLPEKVIEAQALIGDSSDNVPGVKGIGAKTAANLLNEYGSLENIFNNVENISKPALKAKLETSREIAMISLELVSLKKDVKIDTNLDDLKNKEINPKELYQFVNKLSFNSLATNILNKYNLDVSDLNTEDITIHGVKNINQVERKPLITKEISNIDQLNKMITEFNKERYIPLAYTLENKEITSLSLFNETSNTNYIILTTNIQNDFFQDIASDFSLEYIFKALKKILEDNSIKKIIYNTKPLLHILKDFNITINSFEDIMLMAYLVKGIKEEEGIKSLVKNFLEQDDNEDFKANTIYNLFILLENALIENKSKYLYEIFDKPLIQVLFAMEKNGIIIDKGILDNLFGEFNKILSDISSKIFELSKEEFNIASPKQLGIILFEKLGYKGKKNKNGQWKTDVSILEIMAEEDIEIASLIIKWRQLSKLQSTYIIALSQKIDATSKRVHTNYLQCSTLTARLSSNDPNLQNIPIKTEEGRQIRKSFIAKEGYDLISLDYSQVELKILATIAKVDKLIVSFLNQEDIHKKTASEIFSKDINDITEAQRRNAKAINFGIIYGQTVYGLASHLNIAKSKAESYINKYFETYPEIRDYMEETITFASKYGYVATLYNRKCFIANINSRNHHLKSFAQRSAINARIQGSAADIMRKALIDAHKLIEKENLEARILLQIHDEIVVEAKKEKAKEIAEKLKRVMELSLDNNVYLNISYNISQNWLDSHS